MKIPFWISDWLSAVTASNMTSTALSKEEKKSNNGTEITMSHLELLLEK